MSRSKETSGKKMSIKENKKKKKSSSVLQILQNNKSIIKRVPYF